MQHFVSIGVLACFSLKFISKTNKDFIQVCFSNSDTMESLFCHIYKLKINNVRHSFLSSTAATNISIDCSEGRVSVSTFCLKECKDLLFFFSYSQKNLRFFKSSPLQYIPLIQYFSRTINFQISRW